jgi:hypothetical protein
MWRQRSASSARWPRTEEPREAAQQCVAADKRRGQEWTPLAAERSVIRSPERWNWADGQRRALEEDMSAASKVALSSLLVLALASMAAIGAPPSAFIQGPSFWLRLEPFMFPGLFTGVALALLALALAPFVGRAAAIACMGAALASMVGVPSRGVSMPRPAFEVCSCRWPCSSCRHSVLARGFGKSIESRHPEVKRRWKRVPDNNEMHLTRSAPRTAWRRGSRRRSRCYAYSEPCPQFQLTTRPGFGNGLTLARRRRARREAPARHRDGMRLH